MRYVKCHTVMRTSSNYCTVRNMNNHCFIHKSYCVCISYFKEWSVASSPLRVVEWCLTVFNAVDEDKIQREFQLNDMRQYELFLQSINEKLCNTCNTEVFFENGMSFNRNMIGLVSLNRLLKTRRTFGIVIWISSRRHRIYY